MYLIGEGANVNATDANGRTALMGAMYRGHPETISELLSAGAAVDAADADGRTALMYAATRGSPETVLSLISAGAAVNATSVYGETALMYARASLDDINTSGGGISVGLIPTYRQRRTRTVDLLVAAGAL